MSAGFSGERNAKSTNSAVINRNQSHREASSCIITCFRVLSPNHLPPPNADILTLLKEKHAAFPVAAAEQSFPSIGCHFVNVQRKIVWIKSVASRPETAQIFARLWERLVASYSPQQQLLSGELSSAKRKPVKTLSS